MTDAWGDTTDRQPACETSPDEDNVVCQVWMQPPGERDERWVDYVRGTKAQTERHVAQNLPGKFRGVDWLDKSLVVVHPTGRHRREGS
jgi:hypothetical protein